MVIKGPTHTSLSMPKSEKAPHLPSKRLGPPDRDKRALHDMAYIHFLLGQKEHYGVPYPYVQEIVPHGLTTKPPFVPHFIAGVTNWRGALITVVDLIKFFHPTHSEDTSKQQSTFILIINAHNITLGFLAHHLEGSETLKPSELNIPSSSGHAANPEYLLGIHRSVIAILNVDVLIPRLVQEIKQKLV